MLKAKLCVFSGSVVVTFLNFCYLYDASLHEQPAVVLGGVTGKHSILETW